MRARDSGSSRARDHIMQNPKLRALSNARATARRLTQSLAATLIQWRGPAGPAAALYIEHAAALCLPAHRQTQYNDYP